MAQSGPAQPAKPAKPASSIFATTETAGMGKTAGSLTHAAAAGSSTQHHM